MDTTNLQEIGQQAKGAWSLFFCLGSGAIAAIPPQIELWIRCAAGVIAIASGLMAIRYYHFATKEKIQSIKNK